jgi:hypothetical protein
MSENQGKTKKQSEPITAENEVPQPPLLSSTVYGMLSVAGHAAHAERNAQEKSAETRREATARHDSLRLPLL